MSVLAPPRRSLRVPMAALAIALFVGGVVLVAHFSGFLAPLYHLIGLHEMAGHAEQEQQAGHVGMGHAGHGTVTAAKGEPSKVPGYAVVAISPERQQLIGVRTGIVKRDRLLMAIRTVGIVEPDQTRLAHIHTRVSGWVTKVHVNFVGQEVAKGDPLLEIYSPDLLATQEEYLTALKTWEELGKAEVQKRLVEAARRRMELWDVPADELRELTESRKARETLRLRAPLGGRVLERSVQPGSYVEPAAELYRIADLSVVWLQAKVYEHELPHIEVDQLVQVTVPSQPGKVFPGKISFIEPVLQEVTRTVKVRVVLENRDGLFRPGMYADLRIEHDMGRGLLVPESAVLRTGDRAMAFRALKGGRFEPIELKLGGRFDERFEVLGGLREGDEVVTSGNFLIDSDSRLKSAIGMMGHGH